MKLINFVCAFLVSSINIHAVAGRQYQRRQQQQGETSILEVVESSPFALTLYPTPRVLDDSSLNKLNSFMKTSLLLSASVTTNFVDAIDAIVVFRSVTFQDSTISGDPSDEALMSTTVRFTAQMQFEIESEVTTLPSVFAVDNLVVRTFSQPSSKSSFLVKLGLSRDELLEGVEDLQIELNDGDDDSGTGSSDSGTKNARRLSNGDIIAIVLTIILFILVVACVAWALNKDHNSQNQDPSRDTNDDKKDETDVKSSPTQMQSIEPSTNIPSSQNTGSGDDGDSDKDGTRVIPVEENIVDAGSLESSIDEQSNVDIPATDSSVVSFTSSNASSQKSGTTVHADDETAKQNNINVAPLLPDESKSLSSSSSSSASSSSSSSSSSSGSSTPSNEQELLGAKAPDYHKPSSPSKFTRQLLSLPTVASFSLYEKGFMRSSASAPPILEGCEELESKEFDEKSTQSARSAASSESASVGDSRRFYTFVKSDDFDKNWLESKALADIEEGREEEDVFHVGVDGTNSDDRKNKSMSSIDAWLSSVRVVASETESSQENSEESTTASNKEDVASTDTQSLEQSLAASLVEPSRLEV